jgi:hypothetical protein
LTPRVRRDAQQYCAIEIHETVARLSYAASLTGKGSGACARRGDLKGD